MVQGLECMVYGLGLRAQGFGFRVSSLGSMVQVARFRAYVQVLGFRVQC